MRTIAVVILLLSSMLFAETQEAVYLRAMQAEESGDIILAIQSFEEALSIEGPYFEEIAEILNEYYEALGIPLAQRHRYLKNTEEIPQDVSPWSYRFYGELSSVGVRYSASNTDAAWGSVLQGAFSPFVDYASGQWIHSVGLNLLCDFNFNNEEVLALDSNDWKGTLGLEYSLVGEKMLVDVGVDLFFYQQEKMNPAFYAWLEYDFYKQNKNRVGAALWAYYDVAGPMSLAFYGVWQKTSTYGFSFSVMAGAKLDADSTFDYRAFVTAYDAALDAVEEEMNDYSANENWVNPFEQCLELYGEQCYEWNIATIDSLNWVSKYQSLLSEINVEPVRYWTKWMGPSLKAKAFYRFNNGLSLEAKMNLFYGLVMDGPDVEFEKISRFSGVWTGTFNWSLGCTKLYFALEDSYKMYILPSSYSIVYPKHSNVLKFKLGSRWDF